MKKTITTIILALLVVMIIVTACSSNPNTQAPANTVPKQQVTGGENAGDTSNVPVGTNAINDNGTNQGDVSGDLATVNTPDDVGPTDDMNVSTDIPQ